MREILCLGLFFFASLRLCVRSFRISELASDCDSTGNTFSCAFSLLRLCVRSFRINPSVTRSLHLPGPLYTNLTQSRKKISQKNSFASDRKSRSLASVNDSVPEMLCLRFFLFCGFAALREILQN